MRKLARYGTMTLSAILIVINTFSCSGTDRATWRPVKEHIMTRWAKEVTPAKVLPEYPRPQLIRKEWHNLNGLWEYAIMPREISRLSAYDGHILVPFPVESPLSGVMKPVGETNRLWYRRTFEIPDTWSGRRILLHFGAVDWETTVWINGREMGSHRGGYDSFTFDITEALIPDTTQEVVVAVWDPSNRGTQPRGKQVDNPRGIWYTSVTGIWQTVWLEPVPDAFIASLKVIPDIDAGVVRIKVNADNNYQAEVVVKDGGKVTGELTGATNSELTIGIEKPKLWSPNSPHLYDLHVALVDREGKTIDKISSYFGMRKISLGKDERGFTRMWLNNEFVFQFGPLDQGWWPDGLYAAPTDEALRYDIEITKQLGFNMARKHVKIEPERWYYWCDMLGLLVWQDMPSGDEYIDPGDPDIERSPESARQFELELRRLIEDFGNHPSIVVWVPYNEGWGQYKTEGIVDYIKSQDPTRLVDNASGWADRGVGDIRDKHDYPGPSMPEPETERAVVLGEFGGLGLPLAGHTWQDQDNWGYRQFNDVEELTTAYAKLIRDLYPLIRKGLSAAVYTQTTDVEIEVNGLMTYDRAVVKMDMDDVARINQGYLPPIIHAPDDIFLHEMSVRMHNVAQQGEIRYTENGSMPNEKSTLYTEPLVLTGTTTLKARTFWPDGSASAVSEKTYPKVALQAAEQVNGLQAGLLYAYYEDEEEEWWVLPDFDELTPVSTGIATKCSLKPARRSEWFGLTFEGYLRIPEDGVYTFYTNSDDGSKLFIGPSLVVDNDYDHPMVEKRGQIALEAGTHPLVVTFFQGAGGKGLEVSYEGPGMPKGELPPGVLYHNPDK